MKKGLILLTFPILFLSACSSKPSSLDAQKVFENLDPNTGKGFFRILKFQKANAQEGELAGIRFYNLEYEAEIEFSKKTWEVNLNYVKDWDDRFPCFVSDIADSSWADTLYQKGDRKKIHGILIFHITERGWRGEDGNIYK